MVCGTILAVTLLLSSSITHAVPMSARGDAAPLAPKNVVEGTLEQCGSDPPTGFYRDGVCSTGPDDGGIHVVCAAVTTDFLEYTKSQGNDLSTPHPPGFLGLKDGDRWCLCVRRWREAREAGHAPPVALAATHHKALEVETIENLRAHAIKENAKDSA